MVNLIHIILPISMIGRTNNNNKMSILPKFLHLFWSISLPPPASLFFTIKKIFTCFIRNNKCPRQQLSLLYQPYNLGGLKLPNMKLYYWAAHLRAAMCHFYTTNVPTWTEIENNTLQLSLYLYLFSSQIKKLIKHAYNPFLKNTILIWVIWQEAHTFLNETIWGSNSLKPGRCDAGFKHWHSNVIPAVNRWIWPSKNAPF